MNPRLNRTKEVLWVLAMFGLVALVLRIFFGLGATTNLTDAMPWGLWKIFNMVAGVALATGGFTLAAIVYVFHLEKYRSLMKPAIVVAFLGYGTSVTSLLFDIGLPHRIWHPLVPGMWNHHSFLFEVCWCVFLYFNVSIIELSPTILEKFPRTEGIVHWLHKYGPWIVMVGITLSTLHHTSLGSLFLVTPARLHPLWYTGDYLPLQFFTSAVAGGMMTVILVSIIYAYLFNRKTDLPAMEGVAKASAWFLAAFLALRVIEFTAHHKWGIVFSGQWESYVFYAEIIIQVFIPVFIVAVPRWRKSNRGLATAAAFAMFGLAMQRLDTGITGYVRWLGTPYFPSLTEIAFTVGIYSAAALVFIFLAQYFNVFEEVKWGKKEEKLEGGLNALWWEAIGSIPVRVSLLVVLAIPAAILLFSTNALQGFPLVKQPIAGPTALDENRNILHIDGNRNGIGVNFNHERHKHVVAGIVGEKNACKRCHHLSLPNDKSTACFHCHTDMMLEKSIFNHSLHERKLGGKKSCAQCHELSKPESLENSKRCTECHRENMGMEPPAGGGRFDRMAPGYKNAMHELCITCHKQQAAKVKKPGLPECATCHRQAKIGAMIKRTAPTMPISPTPTGR